MCNRGIIVPHYFAFVRGSLQYNHIGGPVNEKRLDEMRVVIDTIQSALFVDGNSPEQNQQRREAIGELLRELLLLLNDERRREEAAPILAEVQEVFQMVAVEVLEIRGSRAVRSMLQLSPVGVNR